jgi:hypothetical protein
MAVTPVSGELAGFSRVRLGVIPSPLEALPRLGAAVGGPQLWVKRDVSVGPAIGGNKTRKLEYLFGQARAGRAEVVVTFGVCNRTLRDKWWLGRAPWALTRIASNSPRDQGDRKATCFWPN